MSSSRTPPSTLRGAWALLDSPGVLVWPTTPTPLKQERQGSYLAKRGLDEMHEGHIGQRQHFVTKTTSKLFGGKEEEQARQRLISDRKSRGKHQLDRRSAIRAFISLPSAVVSSLLELSFTESSTFWGSISEKALDSIQHQKS